MPNNLHRNPEQNNNKPRGLKSYRIHGTGLFTYMNGWFFWLNVGKYTSPMDPMGRWFFYPFLTKQEKSAGRATSPTSKKPSATTCWRCVSWDPNSPRSLFFFGGEKNTLLRQLLQGAPTNGRQIPQTVTSLPIINFQVFFGFRGCNHPSSFFLAEKAWNQQCLVCVRTLKAVKNP